MSAFLNKAVAITIPYDVGSNEFGVMKIDSDDTHKACALPDSWSGCAVAFRCFTNNVNVGLSTNVDAEIDRSVSASDAGASAKVGATVVAGTLYAAVLPTWAPAKTMYLIHEAAANNTVFEIWRMRYANEE